MDTAFVLSIIFAIIGFIVANLIVYQSFGYLEFWDCVVFGTVGVCIGALIGVFIAMVVISIVF